MRKANFEVPFPWSESVKYTRRYRNGWFDGARIGEYVDSPTHYGTYNSIGRNAYRAGFEAGYKHFVPAPTPKPLPTPDPTKLPPPQASELIAPYLPAKP